MKNCRKDVLGQGEHVPVDDKAEQGPVSSDGKA
ncbi:hypothetical protein QE368_000019 [Asaia bogorensis NBRC 16594]|nr:hypothetical protein [Asaia bogorensis NBRC 16594]